MRLTELDQTYEGEMDPDILGLTQDSRQVRQGWLFAAIPGSNADGRAFIADAVENGAVAVLASPGTDVPGHVALVGRPNPRQVFALMAARFYGAQPDVIVAVTGTNGKTSTVNFTQQLWENIGHKAASLGTLGVRARGMVRSGSMTTPDPVALHGALADMAASGITHLAIEASSHGLEQYRLDGVQIRAAGFTNLTRDHLDYHADMTDYLAAKTRLFSELLLPQGVAVLNADVPEFPALKEIAAQRRIRVLSYGCNGDDIRLLERTPKPEGQEIVLSVMGENHSLGLPLVGEFQVMNALCALGLVMAEDIGNVERTGMLVRSLARLKGVPGRLESVPGHPSGAAIYVDYAHTPDALENVLKALRPHTPGRLVCLVGCGGDRDAGKRPLMGKVASEYADMVVITDDNPRTEDPAAIRAQMVKGAPDAKEIGERREAIRHAVKEIQSGDVLVIAGKGHETGQIIGNRIEDFNDVEEAEKAIKELCV